MQPDYACLLYKMRIALVGHHKTRGVLDACWGIAVQLLRLPVVLLELLALCMSNSTYTLGLTKPTNYQLHWKCLNILVIVIKKNGEFPGFSSILSRMLIREQWGTPATWNQSDVLKNRTSIMKREREEEIILCLQSLIIQQWYKYRAENS